MDKVKISVIGLGYVGLPMAIALAKKFSVVGFDINQTRIDELRDGIDNTNEVSIENLKETSIFFTSELDDIADCIVHIVAVPTPIDVAKNPDLRALKSASELLSKILKVNDIVVYESTVYPGVTEEYCVPILEKGSLLKGNLDFFYGYSPERINPADHVHTFSKITKVVSGCNKDTARKLAEIYGEVVEAGIHIAPSIKVAEAAKVIENTQRDINIALMNELAIIFDKLNINTADVLEAASTKWNFINFKPGLVGGHCIGVDPYYLVHKANLIGYHPEIIQAGRRINDKMPGFTVEKMISLMIKANIPIQSSSVGIFGLTFKENCPDLRNSKVIDIIKELDDYNLNLHLTDYYVNKSDMQASFSAKLFHSNEINDLDVLILAVPHKEYINLKPSDWVNKMNPNGIIMDIKSVLDKNSFEGTGISVWQL
ncbi:MAG: nucleotide sugar dehydrogenase [Oligoflexales bacterium]